MDQPETDEIDTAPHRPRRGKALVIAAGAALTVAMVASAVALLADRDEVGDAPTAATPSTSETTPTQDDSPTRGHRLLSRIPDGFPLGTGWPDQTEGPQYGLVGPSRKLPPLDFVACDVELEEAPYVDRLRADWTDVVDYRARQLTVYETAEQAAGVVTDIVELYQACPRTEPDVDGRYGVAEVRETTQEDESWVIIQREEQDGYPASTSLMLRHIIRIGPVVLVLSDTNEGGAGPEGSIQGVVDRQVDEAGAVIEAMTDLVNPPADDVTPITVGPNGVGPVRLRMTWAELKDAGAVPAASDSGCERFALGWRGATIVGDFMEDLGVVSIDIRKGMVTSAGIGPGSTEDELRRAHAHLTGTDGFFVAPVTGPGVTSYRYETAEGMVTSAMLVVDETQGCDG